MTFRSAVTVLPRFALVFAALTAGGLAAAQAQNANWPAKPVKIVVTFPPGGAPDTLARVLADKWGQATGQTITVDNKPGAGGNIGSDYVAKSAADGTTLMSVRSSLTTLCSRRIAATCAPKMLSLSATSAGRRC